MCRVVVTPTHDEAAVIAPTVGASSAALASSGRDDEVIVVDDASTDWTAQIVGSVAALTPRIRSHYSNGFGFAVRAGLDRFEGDAVAIMMGDGSDDPRDLLRSFDRIVQPLTSHHFNLEHHRSRGDCRRADYRDYRAGAGHPSAEPAATARRIRRRMHVRAS